jgi:hypothetical protein
MFEFLIQFFFFAIPMWIGGVIYKVIFPKTSWMAVLIAPGVVFMVLTLIAFFLIF